MANLGSEWYFMKEELENSPSVRDGLTREEERRLRKKSCAFIREVGKKLNLPQLTIATATVFFHRYYTRHSFKNTNTSANDVSIACVFLAAKVHENVKKFKEVVRQAFTVLCVPIPEADTEAFRDTKKRILGVEMDVLHANGFLLHIEHPYPMLVSTAKRIKERIPSFTDEEMKQLIQTAWNFVNDGLHTTLCLQFKPNLISSATLHLASKFLKLNLAGRCGDSWLEILNANTKDIEEIANFILDYYDMDKANGGAQNRGAMQISPLNPPLPEGPPPTISSAPPPPPVTASPPPPPPSPPKADCSPPPPPPSSPPPATASAPAGHSGTLTRSPATNGHQHSRMSPSPRRIASRRSPSPPRNGSRRSPVRKYRSRSPVAAKRKRSRSPSKSRSKSRSRSISPRSKRRYHNNARDRDRDRDRDHREHSRDRGYSRDQERRRSHGDSSRRDDYRRK